MKEIKLKRGLTIICLLVIFSIYPNFAQDSLNAEHIKSNMTEAESIATTTVLPPAQPEEIENQSFHPQHSSSIDSYYDLMKNLGIVITCIISLGVFLIVFVKIRRDIIIQINQAVDKSTSTIIRSLETKLRTISISKELKNVVSKEDFANFRYEILEILKNAININRSNDDSNKEFGSSFQSLSNEEPLIRQTENSQSERKSIPVQKYPIRHFYLDILNKGWRENSGEKVYKCETIEEDPNRARFEINTLTNTTKTVFFNSADLNNTSIIEYKGYAASGKNMTPRKKGTIKRNNDGIWLPELPMEIEFS
jgi:hypothetical protein